MNKCHFCCLSSYKYRRNFINKDIPELYDYKFTDCMDNLINMPLT